VPHARWLRRARPRSRAAIASKARHVIRTLGPVWQGGEAGEPELLAGCYRKCLALADERAVRTISFPAISTGVYGYPADLAAEVAVGTVVGALRADAHFARVVFCCFGRQSAVHHEQALRASGQ
jgi:O-acetyl-ADP-ribose deacetylase (regulator of RNase III)